MLGDHGGATRYGELRGHDELPVVEVTGYLLRICRELARELDHALQRRHEAGLAYGPYLNVAEAVVADQPTVSDAEFFYRPQLDAIADLLAAAIDREDLALRARDLATIVDIHRGRYFFSWFSGRCVSCRPGDPVPVLSGDVVIEEMGTGHGLPPNPDTSEVPPPLEAPLDGTCRLRLCPDGLGKLEVLFDARYDGVVDALFSGDRIAAPGPDVVWAAVIPSCAVFDELDYDRIDDLDPPGFYRVRRKESLAGAYRARVRTGLRIAAQSGASVIVLPELSSDATTEREIVGWFAANRSVALIVAGSRHLDGPDEPRRNRARVLLRGMPDGEELIHDKFSSFSLMRDGVRRVEVIERPNVVRIVAGRRWSFSALICKDFMEPTPRRVLAELRARAVIVAAMSPKTDLFVAQAQAMAQDGQTLIFVSNSPHEAGDDVAISAQPRRTAPRRSSRQAAGGVVATIATNGEEFMIFEI